MKFIQTASFAESPGDVHCFDFLGCVWTFVKLRHGAQHLPAPSVQALEVSIVEVPVLEKT